MMRCGEEMKYKRAKHKCIDKNCSYIQVDNKCPDARTCTKCGMPTILNYVKKVDE